MEDRCWERLGIDPTADTAVIKKAYAKQLKFNKPDKNPEGFRDLRAAYEEALDESYWYEEEDNKENDSSEELLLTVADVAPDLPLQSDGNDDHDARDDEKYHDFPEEIFFAIAASAPDLPLQSDGNDDHDARDDEKYHDFPEEISFAKAPLAPDLPLQSDRNDDHDVRDGEKYHNFPEEISFAIADATPVQLLDDSNIDGFYEDSFDEESFDKEHFGGTAEIDDTTSPFSAWVEAWEQAVGGEYAITDGNDMGLQTLLQSQLDTIRPLDEQNDFEEALLVWLADQESLFPTSYQLVKAYFHWDKRLEHWSHNDYPWYRLESLNERYQQITYFQSPAAFRAFLALRFPVVASYWPAASPDDSADKYDKETSSKDESRVELIKRLYVFKRLFFPFRVVELASELEVLDQELTYYRQKAIAQSNGAMIDTSVITFNAQYWQQDSPLKNLNDWVFKRFIKFEDFGVIAMGMGIVLGALSFMFELSWQNFYYDVVGVFITISLYYLFWQLMLRLFATPNAFVMQQPWVTGWRNASIVLFIIGYVFWMDVASADPIVVIKSPIYYLTHAAGASLFIANSLRSSILFLKVVSWYAGILLLIVAVVVPLLLMTATPTLFEGPLPPLLWLWLAVPISIFNLSEVYVQLEWLVQVGNVFVKVWLFLIMWGLLVLFYDCTGLLPKVNFGFTAMAIMVVTVIMSVNLAKFINTNVDEDS